MTARNLDGTFRPAPGPVTHSHHGEHNQPERPGADCDDCRDSEFDPEPELCACHCHDTDPRRNGCCDELTDAQP